MKGKSHNNSGYKYKHQNSTIKAVDEHTKVIQQRDLSDSSSMPAMAEEGDTTYINLDKQFNIKQIREFNPLTQLPTKDIDTDKAGHEGIHAHDWVDGMRQDKRPLTPAESEKLQKIQSLDLTPNNLHYYPIDEVMAKRANDANSMSDYKKGSETAGYKASVDEVFDIADKVKSKLTDEKSIQRVDYLANSYAKRYANWINNHNKIEASVPSILITGAGNFPTKKKERQNEQRGKSYEEYDKIQNIKEQIKNLEHYTPRTEKQGHANNTYNFTNKHFEVIQNEEQNRLQLKFNGKPDSETRDLLKHSGFKWSPKNEAWQRQLTPNARWTTKNLIEKLDNKEQN